MTSVNTRPPNAGFWADRRVLVTGATGMIGSWLVKELLARGASVAVLVADADLHSELYRSGDVRRTTVVNGRLEDFWTLERAINQHETDTVFHLGAQTLVMVADRAPLGTFEANIRGTYNLLEACRMHRSIVGRVVVASSDKAYGDQAELPYLESMALKATRPYEVSKACADLLAQSYHRTYDLPVAVVRCGNVYGGGDLNWSRIIPGTIRSLLRGERPLIRSDGTYQRDYIYVKDVVRAYLTVAEFADADAIRGEAFNFGCEARHTVLSIVDLLRRMLNCDHLEPDIQATAQGEIRAQQVSCSKAHARLGWRPTFDLQAGLVETVQWYRDALGDAMLGA